VTYRDDHDAALARAEALEAELADERAKNRALEGKVDALEGKVEDLREEKELREAAPRVPPTAMRSALQPPVFGDEKPKVDPSRRAPTGSRRGETVATIVVLLLLMFLLALCRAAIDPHGEYSPAHRHYRP
jgi:hypothetical protein